ncbi:hypothetical protein AZE42_12276 [Rhizopogon vesiculosus]|uniref:Uncharacterized protein n=1 Tax=Rhizopogon vesiculosus TaxID=180088 RepID=A0A1J8PJA4_9AGAM|nr:hypothetical protein AZE42_12276 [Rhizopogon vesiculosus]
MPQLPTSCSKVHIPRPGPPHSQRPTMTPTCTHRAPTSLPTSYHPGGPKTKLDLTLPWRCSAPNCDILLPLHLT